MTNICSLHQTCGIKWGKDKDNKQGDAEEAADEE